MQITQVVSRPCAAAPTSPSRTARLLSAKRVAGKPCTIHKTISHRLTLQKRSAAEEAASGATEETSTDDGTTEALVPFDGVIAQFKDALAGGAADQQAAEAFLSAVEAEVADLRAAVATAQNAAGDAEAQAAKLNDQFLRLTADFDNFRKRTATEKQALADTTKGDMLQALLPIVDNFELAKSQLKLESEGEQKVDGAYQGVYRQMVDIFKGFGLEAVPGEGAPFDPEVHEAIMREPSSDVPDGTVLQEFRRGFRMGEKLLRPAMVKVSFQEADASAAEEASPAKEDVPAA